MEVAQFSGPHGCRVMLPKAAATRLLTHVPSKVLCPSELPVTAKTSTRVQLVKRHQLYPAGAQSRQHVCGMRPDHQSCPGAGHSAMSPNPTGWALQELAVPPLPHQVAFAPLILLCCLGNNGIQHRSDLTEQQTSHRDVEDRNGMVRALASRRGLSPSSGHQAGADMDAPWLPHSVKEPGCRKMPWSCLSLLEVLRSVPVLLDGSCLPGASVLLELQHPSGLEIKVNSDGKEMTMARDMSEHRGTLEDTGSRMG